MRGQQYNVSHVKQKQDFFCACNLSNFKIQARIFLLVDLRTSYCNFLESKKKIKFIFLIYLFILSTNSKYYLFD